MKALLLVLMAACGAAVASPFQYGDIFLSASDGNVYRYNQSGTFLQTIHAGAVGGLAFDPAGNLYVTGGTSVQKFDNSGNALGTFVSGFPGVLGSATDIDFDQAGNAYVVGIQDLNFDFIRSYTSAGSVINTGSVPQGQEGFVYVDYAGNNTLLITPGTTNLVDKVSASGLSLTSSLFVLPGGSVGDLEGLAGGGFLLTTGFPINQYDSSGALIRSYNTVVPISGTWVGVDQFTAAAFWASSDFGEVREFNLGTSTPIAAFNTGLNVRGLAVFTTPEPSTIGCIALGLGTLAFLFSRRRL